MEIKNYNYECPVCPECGSENYHTEQIEYDKDAMAQQTMICCECGAAWREIYKFAFAETEECD